ncbi:MAG: V-type ATPase subunit [Tissierellia bacterium]|nr:V-type ATPase subunit [Tissierellia bacterium]
MNPFMAFDAVNTKIISRLGSILDYDKWNKYIEFSSVEQLIDYLKKQPIINKNIDYLKNNNINRESLEVILGKIKTIEIEDLISYFSGPYKEFVKSMLIDSEINDISLIFRKISRGESLEDIKKRFIHSEKFSHIPFEKLLTSNSIDNFTKNLKDTPYYIGLRNISKEDAINREFHIEMKLQGVYYNTILEKADKLFKEDKDIAFDLIGYRVDFENIQWIYRAIKYYNITPEEILIYSLKGGKKIKFNRLKNLCYAKSEEELKNLTRDYLKQDIFKDNLSSEISVKDHMFNYLRNKHFNNLGYFIAYIFYLEIAINDLTSITEGIKYNVPKEKIKEYLAYRYDGRRD